LVASSAFGEYRLKSSGYEVAPVATVSTPVGPDDDDELEPLPLLLQAASRPAATRMAPAAIARTRQGLGDIGDSLLS
jgi:hypothetical protein